MKRQKLKPLGGSRGIILGMPENENQCSGCENNCCKSFRLYRGEEEILELIEMYPFFRVVNKGIALVGGHETAYRVLECDRLQEDGSCEDYPENRPPFCENTGVKTRPAVNCKLHDYLNNKK